MTESGTFSQEDIHRIVDNCTNATAEEINAATRYIEESNERLQDSMKWDRQGLTRLRTSFWRNAAGAVVLSMAASTSFVTSYNLSTSTPDQEASTSFLAAARADCLQQAEESNKPATDEALDLCAETGAKYYVKEWKQDKFGLGLLAAECGLLFSLFVFNPYGNAKDSKREIETTKNRQQDRQEKIDNNNAKLATIAAMKNIPS